TRGGQHTGADTRVDPIQSAVAALPVVANQEYLHLDCRSVDLDPAYSPVEAASVLAAELRRPTANVRVAHRGDTRLVADYAPLPAEPAETAIRPGGTYVISGGLGEIGLIVAEHLATRGASTLILVSRSGLPEDP